MAPRSVVLRSEQRRGLVLVVVALLGILTLTSCGTAVGSTTASAGDAAPAASGEAGGAALDFTGTTVDDRPFSGASLAGTPTVLWFWAPWCPTCQGQVAGVNALADEYGGRVNVVGVGGLDDASAIADFAEDVSPDVTMLTDPEGAVWRHFAITAQSTYVVLDADGTLVDSGYLSDEDLAALVDRTVA